VNEGFHLNAMVVAIASLTAPSIASAVGLTVKPNLIS
jgi:hypothetical protein